MACRCCRRPDRFCREPVGRICERRAGGLGGVAAGHHLGDVVTLAGVALYILPTPGGSVPRWFSNIPLLIALILPSLILLTALCWSGTRSVLVGTAIMAVGEDDSSAFTSGINVRVIRRAPMCSVRLSPPSAAC